MIEIQGIWTNGHVEGRNIASEECSLSTAIEYLKMVGPATGARLWLVRFFKDGKLVREWDDINKLHNLSSD